MPLTAVPQGVEIRKLSAAQKNALDKLLESQNGSSTKNTALAVGIPTIALALGGMAFLFRNEIKETVKESWTDIKEFAEGIPAGMFTGTIDAGFALGKEITGVDLTDVTGRAETVFGEGVSLCEQYGYDLVELQQRVDKTPSWNVVAITLLGIGKREKLKGMKKNGCSKPPYIKQNDWDRV